MLVSSAISEPLRLMCPIAADEARRVLGSGGKMHVAMERCDRAFARKRRVPIGTKADDITGHKRRVRGTASLVLILGAVSTELPKCRGGKEGTRGYLSCAGLERKRASHLALRLQRHTTIAHDTWPKACGFRRGDMPCSPTKLRKARPRHRRYAAALAHPSCTGGVLAVPRRLTAASRPSARGRCGWRCLLRRPRACRPRWRSRRRRRHPRTPSRRRHSAGRARRS